MRDVTVSLESVRQARERTATPEAAPATAREPINWRMWSRRFHLLPILVALALAVLAGLWVGAARGAPVPAKKAVKKQAVPAVAGTWQMAWTDPFGEWPGEAKFNADGTYQHITRGDLYVGTWTVSGNRLTVRERLAGRIDSAWIDWGVDVQRSLDGKGWQGVGVWACENRNGPVTEWSLRPVRAKGPGL